jgi:hypothetical protein
VLRIGTWFADFVNWYNTKHLHSGIGYVTPRQKRTGETLHIYAARNRTIAAAQQQNPLRWCRSKTMNYQALPVKAFYRPIAKSA